MLARALLSTFGELTRGRVPITTGPKADTVPEDQRFARWSRDVRGHQYLFEVVAGL